MDIDLDDVDNYPASVMRMYENKKKKEEDVKRKDERIDKISDEFHMYLEKRAENVLVRRKKNGLKRVARKSPLEDL